jgi:hypothetical protein
MGIVVQFPQRAVRWSSVQSMANPARVLRHPRLSVEPLQRSLDRLAGQDPAIGKSVSALSMMLNRLLRHSDAPAFPGR